MTTAAPLSWPSILRLGLVQSSLGAMVALTTSTLNRVMVVEYALPASLPAFLVAWHYALQVSRPRWGYGGDRGGRTPWIIVGMGLLALGTLLAANAAVTAAATPILGIGLAVLAYTLIGAGVSASGTSLLAMLATQVAPERRPAAASMVWIMMIVGIVLTTAVTGKLLDPFSPQRLVLIASSVAGVAFLLTVIAVAGVERAAAPIDRAARVPFRAALQTLWRQPLARDFTIFVFVSMLAYSAQELILEPFAGIVFGYTLGQSTALMSLLHSGVLAGMVAVGIVGSFAGGDRTRAMAWTSFAGCALSALALIGIAAGGLSGPSWPLQPTVFALGVANGVFAVSAIALMMAYAGRGSGEEQGLRMGVWGAAQAIAFGIGGLAGGASLDVVRHLVASSPAAFAIVFLLQAAVFLVAAVLIVRLGRTTRPASAGPFELGISRG